MTDYQNIPDLLRKAEEILYREPRLIELSSSGQAVFVGDTHGDLEATKKVINKYRKKGNTIVFLGDYVDRGLFSEENILFLLSLKVENPHEIILLTGNHECFTIKRYGPADFWLGLPEEKKLLYGSILTQLPLAAHSKNGILALHGALPDLDSLEEINRILPLEKNWDQIVWGDFYDVKGERIKEYSNRPSFGFDYFNRLMAVYSKNILIRSHQPDAKSIMYHKRCLTIFTSSSYFPKRDVAIVDLAKEKIRSTDDVTIEEI